MSTDAMSFQDLKEKDVEQRRVPDPTAMVARAEENVEKAANDILTHAGRQIRDELLPGGRVVIYDPRLENSAVSAKVLAALHQENWRAFHPDGKGGPQTKKLVVTWPISEAEKRGTLIVAVAGLFATAALILYAVIHNHVFGL